MSIVSIFFDSRRQRMKHSNFAKISRLFQTSVLLHMNISFCNSIFRLPKDCFSKYHLTCFAGSDLGLIVLKWNQSSGCNWSETIALQRSCEIFWTTKKVFVYVLLFFLGSRNFDYTTQDCNDTSWILQHFCWF